MALSIVSPQHLNLFLKKIKTLSIQENFKLIPNEIELI